jgi:hypothetical protein
MNPTRVPCCAHAMALGNIGSFLIGLSTVVIAIAVLRQGPAVVRAWIERAHAQAEAAQEEADNTRLERQRYLSGWSAHGIWTYGVKLVTGKDELEQAARELSGGEPTTYVVFRVTQGGSGAENAAPHCASSSTAGGISPAPLAPVRLRRCAEALMQWTSRALGSYPGRRPSRCRLFGVVRHRQPLTGAVVHDPAG